jgi:hypothetical protein
MQTDEFGFVYYTAGEQFDENVDYVARLPPGLRGSQEVFDALFQHLQFPGYFGFNWNALSDCLRDLSWISQRRVVILHSDLPVLPSDEVATYLEVMWECLRDWKPSEPHQLIVAFPDVVRSTIHGLLEQAKRSL